MLDDSDPYLDSLEAEDDFNWQLQGRVIAIDNGGLLAKRGDLAELMNIGSLACIVFDPASDLHDRPQLRELEEFQLFSHATLGNGQATELFACLDPADSATLEPLPAQDNEPAPQVLARLPISTVALDSIEGLESIDWLLLDDRNDNLAILEGAAHTLQNLLALHIRVPLQPRYQQQATLHPLIEHLRTRGFELYTFCNYEFKSHFPAQLKLERPQATQLDKLDLLFLPNSQRLHNLSENQRAKLSHILTVGYRINDLSYELIAQNAPLEALQYLIELKFLRKPPEASDDQEQSFTLTAEYSPDIWELRL